MTTPSVYDHVRLADATGGELPDRVYRVVGIGDDAVTLLVVTDADGRRANTGHVVTVDRDDVNRFVSAPNPDGSRPIGAVVSSSLSAAYWSARVFVRGLVARPLASAALAALVAGGVVLDDVVPNADAVAAALVFAGTVGLVFVANGRL